MEPRKSIHIKNTERTFSQSISIKDGGSIFHSLDNPT